MGKPFIRRPSSPWAWSGEGQGLLRPPSYVGLVLTLVHNYNIDINKPVLSGGYSVFHCALLSTSLELVTSLSPMADLDLLTSQGDSPLYLAVYAAAHRLRSLPASCQEGLEIVQHLLEAGCDVNLANKAGWSALHQASRLGHERMIRLLLDWGAEMRSGTSHNNTLASSRTHDISLLSILTISTRGWGLAGTPKSGQSVYWYCRT